MVVACSFEVITPVPTVETVVFSEVEEEDEEEEEEPKKPAKKSSKTLDDIRAKLNRNKK